MTTLGTRSSAARAFDPFFCPGKRPDGAIEIEIKIFNKECNIILIYIYLLIFRAFYI